LINDPTTRHFNEVNDLGIALRTFRGEAQIHIGLLYKIDNAAALMLHLRWHFDVKNDAPTDEYRWIQIDLDEINRRNLAGLCRLIASRADKIPYGLNYNGLYFSAGGEYLSRARGEGLTCATFVMAVFETYKIPILKLGEWSIRPEDIWWQLGQVQRMEQTYPLVAPAMKEFVGQARFRPPDATAGAISAKRPLGIKDAEKLGKRIVTDLMASYKGRAP
jgi:hypothetical protein